MEGEEKGTRKRRGKETPDKARVWAGVQRQKNHVDGFIQETPSTALRVEQPWRNETRG